MGKGHVWGQLSAVLISFLDVYPLSPLGAQWKKTNRLENTDWLMFTFLLSVLNPVSAQYGLGHYFWMRELIKIEHPWNSYTTPSHPRISRKKHWPTVFPETYSNWQQSTEHPVKTLWGFIIWWALWWTGHWAFWGLLKHIAACSVPSQGSCRRDSPLVQNRRSEQDLGESPVQPLHCIEEGAQCLPGQTISWHRNAHWSLSLPCNEPRNEFCNWARVMSGYVPQWSIANGGYRPCQLLAAEGAPWLVVG